MQVISIGQPDPMWEGGGGGQRMGTFVASLATGVLQVVTHIQQHSSSVAWPYAMTETVMLCSKSHTAAAWTSDRSGAWWSRFSLQPWAS